MYESWVSFWINSHILKMVFKRSVMSESVRVSIKKPEAAKEDRTSQARKSNYSQPVNSSIEHILFLQRTIGNQAVGRLIKSGALQAKLRIGQPGDKYEQEADRVADQVMRMPGSERAFLKGTAPVIGHARSDMVQRNGDKKPSPMETPIRGEGSVMLSPEVSSATVYELPDETSMVLSQFDKKTPLKLVATSGSFYAVEIQGKKCYVKQWDFISVVDTDWEEKADAASKAMDVAGHTQGPPLRGSGTAPVASGKTFPQWFMDLQNKLSLTIVWKKEEESAQNVLRNYAKWYIEQSGGKLLPNVNLLLEYIGRSSINDAEATRGNYKAASRFGGGLLPSGRPKPNWCAPTSNLGLVDALKQMGYAPKISPIDFINAISVAKAGGEKLRFWARRRTQNRSWQATWSVTCLMNASPAGTP